MLAALAEGLADLQGHGVWHRDLKPHNVILSATGPQLIDFGIARTMGAAELAQVGSWLGTPGYIGAGEHHQRRHRCRLRRLRPRRHSRVRHDGPSAFRRGLDGDGLVPDGARGRRSERGGSGHRRADRGVHAPRPGAAAHTAADHRPVRLGHRPRAAPRLPGGAGRARGGDAGGERDGSGGCAAGARRGCHRLPHGRGHPLRGRARCRCGHARAPRLRPRPGRARGSPRAAAPEQDPSPRGRCRRGGPGDGRGGRDPRLPGRAGQLPR